MSNKFDFNEKEYQLFMSRLKQDFVITTLSEMKGGYSGARTSLVKREPLDSGKASSEKGKYILKVCFSEDAEREIQNHARVYVNDILGKYVPTLVDSITFEGMPLVGIFYQIAGEDLLRRTTLQEILEQQQASSDQNNFLNKQIEELSGIILHWNFEATHVEETPDLLGTILQGIGEGRLKALEERLKEVAENFHRPAIHFAPLIDASMYNPIYFLHNLNKYTGTRLRQMPYLIPIGVQGGEFHLHGDLHPGNVIVSEERHLHEPFHVIDFASSRSGNVFFDLAYLEISILLNSHSGFDRTLDLKNWWALEQHLITKHLPSEKTFRNAYKEGLWRTLPVRRALDARIKSAGGKVENDYWIAFLAASVEAGLDLARKLYRNSSLQRVAFLTAVSRFHRLIQLLKALEIPPRGEMATIYLPEDKRVPHAQEQRAKIDLVWPGEIIHRNALYDPWKIVDEIWSDLTRTNGQGVLLIGERISGKSSFFNCVNELFSKEERNLRVVSLDTLSIEHSVRSFADEVLRRMRLSIGLQNSLGFNASMSRDFDIDSFVLDCQSIVNEGKGMRFVICIDEIDNTLITASSEDDASLILRLLSRLRRDPNLSVRLFLTATNKEVLKRHIKTGFVDKLRSLPIPQCSKDEMSELIERFELPLMFDKEALERIFHFSGGQIYFIKLAVKLALSASAAQIEGKRLITGRMIDELMRELIEPTAKTVFTIRGMNGDVFPTMKNIFSVSFSEEERQFIELLTWARGTLRVSKQESETLRLMNVARLLFERGYVSLKETRKSQEYSWRVGIWQLFLENYLQTNYRRYREDGEITESAYSRRGNS